MEAKELSNSLNDNSSGSQSVTNAPSEGKKELTARLISGLNDIPNDWVLTPVDGQKRPYRQNWQSEEPLSREAITRKIKTGDQENYKAKDGYTKQHFVKALGYGLRTGEVSGGILAIDADGHAAEELLQKLSSRDLPDTVTFTSGKPGRRQLLYYIPEQYWDVVKTIKLKTGVKGDDGKEQQLEFRWNGLQSVLPPSVHPETGKYFWVQSPQFVEVAECPVWVIELMLEQTKFTRQNNHSVEKISKVDNSVDVPLSVCLSKFEREALNNGVGEGVRNDTGASLSRGLIGAAARLSYLGERFFEEPRQLFDDFCARCSPPICAQEADQIWRSAEKNNPTATLSDDAITNCIKAWKRKQSTPVQKSKLVQKSIVNVDNGVLSTANVDNKNGSLSTIESIVNIVNGILGASKNLIEESRLLDQVYLDFSTEQKLERKTFDRIVATERLRVSEMESDEKARMKQLLAQSNSMIDWFKVLPASLARDLVKDAAVKNIDPVVVWQPLAAAIASLMGVRISLDVESHKIPALLWTATVLETGGGKSRGDQLILSALRKMQTDENERYAEAIRTYKLNYRDWEKSGREGDEPTPPTPRKYLFDVATIQAVVKRSADNGANGSLWARDELAGLFNSLGQFSKGGSDEALQILLKLWDGGAIFVDRVSLTDSFYAEDSALSITGGIQPNVFRRIFEDTEDSNGLQARFLIAVPERQKQKRVKGYCGLSDRLPLLFKWLNELSTTTVKLTPEADDLYSKIIDLSEDYREQTTNTAVRAWLSKWTTQTMRIALILHGIECFYSDRAIASPLQVDTLERALLIAEYYRNQFEFLQEKVSVVDDLTTVMLQIIDRARQCPTGIKLRDTYRIMARTLTPLAKEAGVELSLFTEQLFTRAESEGYCQVVRSGRSVKLIALTFESKYTPPESVDNVDNESGILPRKSCDCQQRLLTKPIVSVDNDNQHVKETHTESELKPLNFPVKAGDRIRCYPTRRHEENRWSVMGRVVTVESDNGWFAGCTIEYRDRKKGSVTIRLAGGNADWILGLA